MVNPEHERILKQSVQQWNTWRNEHPGIKPYFRQADLSGKDLSGADLSGADLGFANLSNAQLRATDFHAADLREAKRNFANLAFANLSSAQLHAADLSRANLHGANLIRAHLLNMNLCSAELSETNFSLAGTGSTNFADVDLSSAKGLEVIQHAGPSTIGIDTIYKSGGRIPEAFLKGAGVPDEFIDFIRSMTRRAIEFYSCFISYSTKDQDFAERLHADLQAKGVRCWFAPHDVKAGEKLHEQIDEAIRVHDKLLLILSEHSMSSEWVKAEIAKARKREVKEGKRVLFPVRLVEFETLRDWECFDADTAKDSAKEIREYFIPDFSNWKGLDSYGVALDKLVKDLKASG